MFMEQVAFAFALVAASFSQQSFPPVSDSCQESIDNVLSSNSTECAMSSERTDVDMDTFCPKIQNCIDRSKKMIKQGCEDERSEPRVDYYYNFHIAIQYKSKCLKDNQKQYCRKRNTGSSCNDCLQKRKQLIRLIMAKASNETRENELSWQDKNQGCEVTLACAPTSIKPGNSRNNAVNASSIKSALFIPMLAGLVYATYLS
jgi:hypothetical protein